MRQFKNYGKVLYSRVISDPILGLESLITKKLQKLYRCKDNKKKKQSSY